MSVLPGEGTHVILYGQVSYPAGTQIGTGYLARPDLAGSYAAVVVAPSWLGITSGLKDVCRRLARHGLAALAVDLYRGKGPARRATADDARAAYSALSDARALADLGDAYRFLRAPGTEWADPDRLGVFGLGIGGRLAVLSAAANPFLRAVAVAHAPLSSDEGRDVQATDVVAELEAPLLGLYGKADELVDVTETSAARRLQPAAEWVIYQDAGHDFLDSASAGFDEGVAEDAVGRLIRFFSDRLQATEEAAAEA